jgi:hypothetical protein
MLAALSGGMLAQTPPKTSTILSLIGKSRAAVEKQLGKPKTTRTNSGFVFSEWKWTSFPTTVNCTWYEGGRMGDMAVSAGPTWKESLKMYGLKTEGVQVKKVGEKGFMLVNVKGLPVGWVCNGNSATLLFMNPKISR